MSLEDYSVHTLDCDECGRSRVVGVAFGHEGWRVCQRCIEEAAAAIEDHVDNADAVRDVDE